MHASKTASRQAVAPFLMVLLLAMSGCGGGGGGGSDTSAGGGEPDAALAAGGGSTGGASQPAGSGTPSGGGTTAAPNDGSGDTPPLLGTDPPNATRGTDQPETLQGTPGDDVMLAFAGDDRLEGGPGNDRMVGGTGNDTYVVTEAGDVVVEAEGEGIDTILTSVSYQLPANVENMIALEPSSGAVLTGNALPNHIVGNPFVHEEIHGLDGDDILDGGGRHGGFLDGGNGNDRLLVSFGELKGGPGADTFVAAGRGAQTSPETPIAVMDFNAAEGDRIEIFSAQAHSSADLFARGILRFDAATSTLVLDFDPTTTAPTSVDQVIILSGVREFDPSWVSFTVPPR